VSELLQYQQIESITWQQGHHDELSSLLQDRTAPLVIKGLVANWPLVQKASSDNSVTSLIDELTKAASPALIFKSEAPASSLGRYFYNDDFSDLNFSQSPQALPDFLDGLKKRVARSKDQQTFQYMASTSLSYCFPDIATSHVLPIKLPYEIADTLGAGSSPPLVSAWLGSQSVAATHFDVPDNLACNVIGQRTFTLFPPEQINNLYIGPMHLTPAGQQVSLVDLSQPNFAQFPKFAEAIKHGFQVKLSPGDALFIPSMWWHNVEAHDDINLLINYWWSSQPAYASAPMDALKHAILSLSSLPEQQKKHWHAIFEHYVFANDSESVAHIPEQAQSYLGCLDEHSARTLRAELIKSLNK
jgi:hypothetical protein